MYAMDAMKQRWINELVKYDFSLEYWKGKNNTVADTLSQISKEADKLLKMDPMIPGNDTVIKVFEEEEDDRKPERHTMSPAATKTIFNNLTSGGGRRAEYEYDTDSAAHREADSIKVNVRSAKLSTQMHVMGWAEAQWEDPEIKIAMSP